MWPNLFVGTACNVSNNKASHRMPGPPPQATDLRGIMTSIIYPRHNIHVNSPQDIYFPTNTQNILQPPPPPYPEGLWKLTPAIFLNTRITHTTNLQFLSSIHNGHYDVVIHQPSLPHTWLHLHEDLFQFHNMPSVTEFARLNENKPDVAYFIISLCNFCSAPLHQENSNCCNCTDCDAVGYCCIEHMEDDVRHSAQIKKDKMMCDIGPGSRGFKLENTTN